MTFTFQPATREQAKARLALEGPSGSGKTYTALTLATAMADRVALIDTERGSASKYAAGGGGGFEFDTLQMTRFDPRDLVGALGAAGSAGYGVVIVDSLSHFWMGQGGMLELVDAVGKRGGGGGNFGGWKEARPYERQMIDALLAYPGHVIVTMRTKSEYVIEEDARGRKQVRKVGTRAEQREGIEFEFDIVGDLDQENTLVVTKSRCPALSGAVINRPGAEMAATVLEWLTDGVDPVQRIVDAVMADGLTYEAALEWHAQAVRRGLLDEGLQHPVSGERTTLGALVKERGQAARQTAAASAASPAAPSPHRGAPPAPAGPTSTPTTPAETPPAGRATAPQMRLMHTLFTQLGVTERGARLDTTSLVVGRPVPSANDLSAAEAKQLLDWLTGCTEAGEKARERYDAAVAALEEQAVANAKHGDAA